MEEPRKIQRLDEVVINRIAAGEVIQRPANALKEMIENSLDAKSTSIQITAKNGGLKFLQIKDNGTGIRREDFEIVCERFTTSKLRTFEDLSTISTYGFRGEALASISHVAHLTITSKTADQKCAFVATYEDGKLKGAAKPVAGNQGTQITVEDLFYNMSVRQIALRSPAEEYQKISDVVGKYAIHNPKTGFVLKKQNESVDVHTPPNSTVVDNIRAIFGGVIARELIEFELENKQLKFKASGRMTNVNYSTKKFQFVLFINHRLVDCQSLRKCIDQIYTTYLPKNMHPFVYMSLEIEPKNVDVNVHPTKHEVHFLNEDLIVEAIAQAVENKLLGSNNCRVFYTQAKLPHAPEPKKVVDGEGNKTVIYDKDFVRTDSSEQKLEKFFGPATVLRKNESEEDVSIISDSIQEMPVVAKATTSNTVVAPKENGKKEVPKNILDSDEEFVEANKEFLRRNESFENKLTKKTSSEISLNKSVNLESSFEKEKVIVPAKLRSVQELQSEIEASCDDALRDLFVDHVFVGSVNPRQSLVQHGTRLYLCDTYRLMCELFYQFVVFHFHNFDALELSEALPIKRLARLALDLPEAGWTPDDGDKEELADEVADILFEKREMLDEYFSLTIDGDKCLRTIPVLINKHVPEMTGIPMYVLRLATEVDWKCEKECFRSFAKETARYYARMEDKDGWQHCTEHVLYPSMKDYFVPSSEFKRNGAILQVADLPQLYKVFERC